MMVVASASEDKEDEYSTREGGGRQVQSIVVADDDEEEDQKQDDEGCRHTLNFSRTISVKSEVFCLVFSEDERFLLACCGDGLVCVFNPSTGSLMSVLAPKRGRNEIDGDNLDYQSQHRSSIKENEATREERKEGKRSPSLSSVEGLELPCTCAAFRPIGKREKTTGVALIGFSRGEFELWHVPSAKDISLFHLFPPGSDGNDRRTVSLLHTQPLPAPSENDRHALTTADEEISTSRRQSTTLPPSQSPRTVPSPIGVEVLCCAYAGDGDSFAIGASDGVVRVYSDDTKGLLLELKPGLGRGAGHSNRVFGVKYHPDDPNILVSGGWDNCVHVWDLSTACATRTIFGPHVCGNAVDVVERTILTGSWRNSLQLETWSLDTGEADGLAFWSGRGSAGVSHAGSGTARRCRLYAAAFGGPESSPGKFVAAGGGDGANEVKVFDFPNDRKLIGSLLGLSSGAISLAFARGGHRLAVGLANGQIHLIDITVVPPQAPHGGSKAVIF